jgi:antirestriction protein ArdC
MHAVLKLVPLSAREAGASPSEFGFDGDVRNAGDISTWIELRTADKRAFFTARSQASKAADYLRRSADTGIFQISA